MPRVIQVIEIDWPRGRGERDDDPCRLVKQYYTCDGEFFAERDEWMESQRPATLTAERKTVTHIQRA